MEFYYPFRHIPTTRGSRPPRHAAGDFSSYLPMIAPSKIPIQHPKHFPLDTPAPLCSTGLMEWFPVDSSNVAEAAHDPEERRLLVRFRSGATYAYHNVPAGILDDLLSAASPGNFVRNELSAYSYSRA